MTDKQTIINGVDVSGYEAYMPNLWKNDCIVLTNKSSVSRKGSPNCC